MKKEKEEREADQYQKEVVKDVDYLERLGQLMKGISISTDKAKQIKAIILKRLGFINLEIRNNQLAVAVAALSQLGRYNHQFWVVPLGMGKTRIILAIVCGIEEIYKQVNKFYVVFPYQNLLEKDKLHHDRLNVWLDDRIVLCSDMKEAMHMTKNDLLILDDADCQLFLQARNLPPKHLGVIAMSSTTVSQEDDFEAEYLDALKFVNFDSLIEKSFDPATPLVSTGLPGFLGVKSPELV